MVVLVIVLIVLRRDGIGLLPTVVRVVRRDSGIWSLCSLGLCTRAAAAGGGRLQIGIDRTVLVRPGRGGKLEFVIGVFVGVYVCIRVFWGPLFTVRV